KCRCCLPCGTVDAVLESSAQRCSDRDGSGCDGASRLYHSDRRWRCWCCRGQCCSGCGYASIIGGASGAYSISADSNEIKCRCCLPCGTVDAVLESSAQRCSDRDGSGCDGASRLYHSDRRWRCWCCRGQCCSGCGYASIIGGASGAYSISADSNEIKCRCCLPCGTVDAVLESSAQRCSDRDGSGCDGASRLYHSDRRWRCWCCRGQCCSGCGYASIIGGASGAYSISADSNEIKCRCCLPCGTVDAVLESSAQRCSDRDGSGCDGASRLYHSARRWRCWCCRGQCCSGCGYASIIGSASGAYSIRAATNQHKCRCW